VAEQAVPQAEKAAKVINEQADKVADNIQPMADQASKTLVDNAKQISEEGPEAADKAQAKVDEIASQVTWQPTDLNARRIHLMLSSLLSFVPVLKVLQCACVHSC
jgi:ElaB/YqjD/DUF883 family membrane-anchored ribosome-binding protein